MLTPLLQWTEMSPHHKDSGRSTAPALNVLAHRIIALISLTCIILAWSAWPSWDGVCTCTTKPRQCHQLTPWSGHESQLHLTPKQFPNDFPNIHMKTCPLPLHFSILETSFVKYVLSPVQTLQIHQNIISPSSMLCTYLADSKKVKRNND